MSNTHSNDMPPREAREWEAQEAARLAQREARARPDIPAASSYLTIAAGLAQPDIPPPPSNLAHVLAARVEAMARMRKREDRLFRKRLRLVFLLGYGSCMLLACLFYRDALFSWEGLPAAQLLSGAAGWIPVLAACAGVTGMLARKSTSRG